MSPIENGPTLNVHAAIIVYFGYHYNSFLSDLVRVGLKGIMKNKITKNSDDAKNIFYFSSHLKVKS